MKPLKKFFVITALSLVSIASAQSSVSGWRKVPGTPAHSAWRFEDIFFADDQNGWVVNMSGEVFKTQDAGETWKKQAQLEGRLRSVEFMTPKIGIIGSISDHSLYRTEDGGETWTAVDPTNTFFQGVCGIAHVGNTFYAVGRFSNNSVFYKSKDAGKTWEKKSLAHLAISLVDVLFVSENEGYITGKGAKEGQGAVLLRTTDGGNTWNVHYATQFPTDHHIWKLERINQNFIVGSIWSSNSTMPTFMIRSKDGGKTFTRHFVSPQYFYVEGIGFYNEKKGWMGGGVGLWETNNGGDNWSYIPVGENVNRFYRLGKKIFSVGKEIHVYEE